MTVTRWAFIKLFVEDLDRMSAFYCSAFGFEQEARIDTEEFVEVVLRQAEQGSFICLLTWKDGRHRGATATAGIVGFMTEDIDAATDRLVGSGGRITQQPFEVSGMKIAMAVDPEGNEIEFVQSV